MKYLEEFRDPDVARLLLEQLQTAVTHPWKIMEVCGGQTHAIMQYGIQELIPD
ncbi:MAG: hydrogenase formation protein HypD, partial [Fidelibacterota bacterium]